MNPYINIWGKGEIGEGTRLAAFTDIGGKVGKNCIIGCFVSIPPGVEIEDEVFIGPGVVFTNDKYPPSGKDNWRKTIIRKRASIGANATILPGLTIGEGAMVGAGSVITKNVPANETWVGNPAFPIKYKRINPGHKI